MKRLKNEKGITLVKLLGYIILARLIITMLTAISSTFRNKSNNFKNSTGYETEFDKINVQFLKEAKTGNNFIDVNNIDENKIAFTNGNIYTYSKEDKAIYLNNNIKIASNITDFSFYMSIENKKQKLTTTVKILEEQKTMEYVFPECSNHIFSDGRCTVCGEKENTNI